MITFRQIIPKDIPALFTIRIATWHNERGAEELEAMGINPESVLNHLKTDHAGWIALDDEKPIGFSMSNRSAGEMWVIAVLPEYEGKGVGKELLHQAEAWLFSHGWETIWLTTDVDESVRAVGFYRHLGWVDWKMDEDRYLQKHNPRETIKLEEHVVSCPKTKYERIVRLKRGPKEHAHRLLLFLDGEHYWRDMNAIPVIENLIRNGHLPDMSIALVGHVSGAARHEDYTCNERYADFIGEAVMPWLNDAIGNLQPQGHTICGLSLSGLMATYLTLRHPNLFGSCLSQSGSHWWKPEEFTHFVRQQSPTTARFWLSVGSEETESNVTHPPTGLLQKVNQIEGVEKTAALLKDMGGTVHYHQFDGGHQLQPWRHELTDALPWLTSTT